MKLSHSRVETFKSCPLKYKFRYIDKLRVIKNQDANNPLYIGTALHESIERGLDHGIKKYLDEYYLMTDDHVHEIMKLENLVPKVKTLLPDEAGMQYEHEIKHPLFTGFIDLIKDNGIYDFKYSNNIDHYMKSPQLHLYKYFYELETGRTIDHLYFVFVPKTFIRQRRNEDLYQFRKRLKETLDEMDVTIKEVPYDPNQVINYLLDAVALTTAEKYEKKESRLCDWCEYQEFCKKGEDYMILPKNERREKTIDRKPDMWIYADSYVGKSTFVDHFEDLLFLNTDGNTDNTTSPFVAIADEVTHDGRLKKRKFAWEVFLDVIGELEKHESSFQTVAIDLIEDLYEHCRLYVYNREGWSHESDGQYGKGWDMVKIEFLSNIKRLKNLGYQIIYISKEIKSEINLKSGRQITVVKPNIQDKTANILAGTVDLTLRAYMDGENRYLQLKKDENVFGGGRFNFKKEIIPLEYDEFMKALEEAQESEETQKPQPRVEVKVEAAGETEEVAEKIAEQIAEQVAEKTNAASNGEETPGRRSRRNREEN